jgi:CubicO group peptidase (beta-lactamase class C family)
VSDEHRLAVDGRVDPRFASVRDEFLENFASRNELGGGVCVFVDGRCVVDLWGGWRDVAASRPWRHDTLVDVFSVGKGLLATAVARLVDVGRLVVDEPLCARWPAFAAAGKESVTLRHVLSHTAGLPALRDQLDDEVVFDPGAMRGALAAEAPWWVPGEQIGYHVNTFGFLVGAMVELATGRTVGDYLREEVAGPIGAELHVGLRRGELDRVAEFRMGFDAAPVAPPGLAGEALMRFNAYWNPACFSGAGVINTARWRTAQHPSTNAHGTARGVATLYDALARGGRTDSYVVVGADALAAAATEVAAGDDVVLERPSRFGLGFQLPMPQRPIGRTDRAFGHFGAGGSLGFCDPGCGVAFGYVTNDMGPRWQNPRNRALCAALFDALG